MTSVYRSSAMDSDLRSSRSSRRASGEDSVEVRRYVDALRRGRWLILLLGAAAAVGALLVCPGARPLQGDRQHRQARARSGLTNTVNVDSLARELYTIEKLLVTTDVLTRAAAALARREPRLGPVLDSRPSVDPNANLIFVTATAGARSARRAIANAVATTFVEGQARRHSAGSTSRRAPGLPQELSTRQEQPGRRAAGAGDPAAHRELGVSLARRGMDLQRRAARRRRRSNARRRKPVRNAVIALFLGLFLGVLLALARDQLVPRVSRAARAQPAARAAAARRVPYVRRRLGRRAARAHRHGVRELPDARRVAALRAPRRGRPARRAHHERAARRGQEHGRRRGSAARSRRPATARCWSRPTCAGRRCTTIMGVNEEPGLTELLGELGAARTATAALAALVDDRDRARSRAAAARRPRPAAQRPQARRPGASARRRGPRASSTRSRRSTTPTSSIDAPPLLGIADTPALARCARQPPLRRAPRPHHARQRDRRARHARPPRHRPVGLVAIGTRSEASPYYVGLRHPALEDA